MRIILIGADGQLGSDLVKEISPGELFSLTEEDMDIANRVINDQTFSPTYTADLAKKAKELILSHREDSGNCGLYHITNNGQCSWFEFARKIFKLSGVEVDLKPISAEEFGAWAKRPPYSVLRNYRLEQQGDGNLRPWPEALKSYLEC